MGGINHIVILWASLGLLAYGGFCLSVAFRGITGDATVELKIAWWTGRALLAVASVALLLVVSRGLNELIGWVIR